MKTVKILSTFCRFFPKIKVLCGSLVTQPETLAWVPSARDFSLGPAWIAQPGILA